MHPIAIGSVVVVGVIASPRVRKALGALQPRVEGATNALKGGVTALFSATGGLVKKTLGWADTAETPTPEVEARTTSEVAVPARKAKRREATL